MANSQRLYSVDTLRGCDMLLITGLQGIIIALCAFFPDSAVMGWLSGQMHHAEWDGFKVYDTIFPLFLFIAGITFPFSFSAQTARGMSRGAIYMKIFRRALFLILLGMIYNGAFRLHDVRVCSVLGRIGLAWALAAVLYMNMKTVWLVVASVVILVGYWLILWLIPDVADPFSFEHNLVGVIDTAITPGRLHRGTFDPEGLLSTLPAIVTALLGMLTGKFIRLPQEKVSGGKKSLYMFLASLALCMTAIVWNPLFPVNKALWTSSFVCAAASYSLFWFSIFYYLIDVRGWRKWTFPFRVIGMNSITIYMATAIIPFWKIAEFFLGGAAGFFEGTPWYSLIMYAGVLAVEWLMLYFLYKKNVFLKV